MTDAPQLLDALAHASRLLAIIAFGVSSGALITEGAVLVPFWRSLRADAFLAWYRQHAGLLLRFFGPLEIAATLLGLAAFGLDWLASGTPSLLLAMAVGLSVAVLAVFPLYFQRVNASFEHGTIAPERVPAELARWARWHWLRTALALGAFLAGLGAGR